MFPTESFTCLYFYNLLILMLIGGVIEIQLNIFKEEDFALISPSDIPRSSLSWTNMHDYCHPRLRELAPFFRKGSFFLYFEINLPQGFQKPSYDSKAVSRILIVLSFLCSAEGKLAVIIFIRTWLDSNQFSTFETTLSLKRESTMMTGMMKAQKTRTLGSSSSRLPKAARCSRNILKTCTGRCLQGLRMESKLKKRSRHL